ncbi:hypothetical protein GUITHDRAFT_73206, partial [Guillardia theta CCMP2712]
MIIGIDVWTQKVRELEAASMQDDFWNDAANAQKSLQARTGGSGAHGQVVTDVQELSDAKAKLSMNEKMSDLDGELVKEAETNIAGLEEDLERWELSQLLSGPFDHRGCLLSIQAGAGGTDAMDWAEMLLRMYTKWAEKKGYKNQLVDHMPGEEAATKSATIEIDAPYAYGYLRGEKGAHRLVRISPFNAQAKRQTSFAGIDVMPLLDEDVTMEIDPKDLEITTMR